jgi:ParB-like chromosome segregation protein Spo0J
MNRLIGVPPAQREKANRMKVTSKSISDIKVGQRRREDFGDLQGLADSIAKYGLFHPVIVDGDDNLVAGERRFA